MYIPPEGTPFENKDAFTDVENLLLPLEHESVSFLGDSNVRTAALNRTTTDGYRNNFDMPFETFEDIVVGGKSSSSLPRRVSQDVVTNNIGFENVGFLQNSRCCYHQWACWIRSASIERCTCKDVSVVDYALVYSDLLSLISEFIVLDFCELYSDVHCPIELKLNIMNVQKADLG